MDIPGPSPLVSAAPCAPPESTAHVAPFGRPDRSTAPDRGALASAAVERGRAGTLAALIDQGLDPDWRTPEGEGLLGIACARGRPDPHIVLLLLKAGANPSLPASAWSPCPGATPLHWAARSGAARLARVLLEAGADVGATDASGCTPLQWTRHPEMASLLAAWGTDSDHEDLAGQTALAQAVLGGRPLLAAALVRAGANVAGLDALAERREIGTVFGGPQAMASAYRQAMTESLACAALIARRPGRL